MVDVLARREKLALEFGWCGLERWATVRVPHGCAGWKAALRARVRGVTIARKNLHLAAADQSIVLPCEFVGPVAGTDGGFACGLLPGRRFFEH
jgi:hypothetical protein